MSERVCVFFLDELRFGVCDVRLLRSVHWSISVIFCGMKISLLVFTSISYMLTLFLIYALALCWDSVSGR